MAGPRAPSSTPTELLAEIDSTNAEAKRRFQNGACGPQWLIARRQNSGYGRRGREWFGAEGDLFATLMVTPNLPAKTLAQYSFVTALAVHATLVELVPAVDFSLKWPNDILLNRAKVSGLLLEQTIIDEKIHLAIGIGVNIVSAPEDVPYKTARLCDFMRDSIPQPIEIVERIDGQFMALDKLLRQRGFAPLAKAWLDHAEGIGEEIIVRLPDRTEQGIFEGLADDGALQLRVAGKVKVIRAGEVFFGVPTGEGEGT